MAERSPSQFAHFCKSVSSPIKNFKGLFSRRESSLHPLDGLRAIAITWVFLYHSAWLMNEQFECFFDNYLVQLINNGDMGVDIFFVLSGFLISYILLKERRKYDGRIDFLNFIRGRFFRLWPALLVYVLVYSSQILSWKQLIPYLIFVNNYTGAPFTHLWSIAVEFQFYLISPFVVAWLDISKNPWIPPLVFFLVSTGLNFGFLYHICPQALERADVWEQMDINALQEGNDGCEFRFLEWIYQNTLTRMSAYVFGMYVAKLHLNESKPHEFYLKSSSVLLEYITVIIVLALSIVGCDPEITYLKFQNPTLIFFWTCLSRQFYSISLSHLIYLMLSPVPEYHIPWYRPVKYIKGMLEWTVWIPVAYLSYSFYITHLVIFWKLSQDLIDIKQFGTNDCKSINGFNVIVEWLKLTTSGVVLASCVSTMMYLFVEKPFIDSRRAFVNKYEYKSLP